MLGNRRNYDHWNRPVLAWRHGIYRVLGGPVMQTLFDPDTMLAPDRELTLAEKFSIFHASNPQVFKELERMTAEMVARGRKRVGMKCLTEVLRFNYYMKTTDPNSVWKLNNSYTSLYARLMVEVHPDWSEVIEIREHREAS